MQLFTDLLTWFYSLHILFRSIILGAILGVTLFIGFAVINKWKWKRDCSKVTGSHNVLVNVYEWLKPSYGGRCEKCNAKYRVTDTTCNECGHVLGIKFHITMTEFTADMLKINEWLYASWSKFLNMIWFDYHNKLEKGIYDNEECLYHFGEKVSSDMDNSEQNLINLMKKHKIMPKDLRGKARWKKKSSG